MFMISKATASNTMCIQTPSRAKSVNRNEPGPKISICVLLPIGEAKLKVTQSMRDMTKGIGLHPNISACWYMMGKKIALAPTSVTNSLTNDASRHITAMTI